MHNPTLLKREFLKKWMMNLQSYKSSHETMTVAERKTAIKLSADVALASSTNRATRWSRAVIAGAVKQSNSSRIGRISWSRSGKILKRSRRVRRTVAARKKCGKRVAAERIAEKMVQRKTTVLRGLVPGGELMDEASLIEETLDYISALQAQVDVMRCLANATAYNHHYHHEHPNI